MSEKTGSERTESERPTDPEELRAELEELRADVGSTVEELAHRVDVPARARAKRDEVTARAVATRDEVVARTRTGAQQALAAVDEKAPAVGRTVREQPAIVLGGLAAVLVLVLALVRRGRKAA